MSCYYEIVPENTYEIIRNCGKCGVKTHFRSTGKFRVNANGNRIDVWLIYQCEKCKHTYNLPIFERINPKAIETQQYAKFLSNDEELAFQMGTDRKLFEKYHCVIDGENVAYSLQKIGEVEGEKVIIHNPYGIKVRIEKLISQIWGLSRSQIKKLMSAGKISYFMEDHQDIVICYHEHGDKVPLVQDKFEDTSDHQCIL